MSTSPERRTAVLEIDFQPWIIDMGHDNDAVIRARTLRAKFRAEGAQIVCTRYLSSDPADSLRSDPNGHGARFEPSMAPEFGDLIVTKFDRDVWTNPDLHAQLQLAAITDVAVMGFVTDFGVDLAARSALRLGYRVSVQSAGCAGTTRAAHVSTLTSLKHAGIEVV